MRVAVVFPGQGSQYNKMGMDFLTVSEESLKFCKAVEEYISISIVDLLSDVEKTDDFSQLRLVVAEILIYLAFKSKFEKSGIKVKYAAGHSLGEYSALYISGILLLSELLDLVVFRNKVIEQNQFPESTTMIALTDSNISSIDQSISRLEIQNLFPSNINSYKQVVYSGTVSAISELKENLKDEVRGVVLKVNQGYHSPLMKDSSEKFKDYIQANDFNSDSGDCKVINVLNNLTGERYKSKEEVLSNLPKQLISPVDWIRIIENISEDVDCIIEIGPGKTLTKFNKNILKKNKVKNVYLGHIGDIKTLDSEIGKINYETNKFEQ